MSNWNVEYSELTGHVYFVIGKNKYDITDYVVAFAVKARKKAIEEYSYQLSNTKLDCEQIPREIVDMLEVTLPMMAENISDYLLNKKES